MGHIPYIRPWYMGYIKPWAYIWGQGGGRGGTINGVIIKLRTAWTCKRGGLRTGRSLMCRVLQYFNKKIGKCLIRCYLVTRWITTFLFCSSSLWEIYYEVCKLIKILFHCVCVLCLCLLFVCLETPLSLWPTQLLNCWIFEGNWN